MMVNFDELNLEYLSYDSELLYNDTDIIKQRILKLPETERRILLLYVELGSFRQVAKVFNVSHTKIIYVIRNIIKKITI